jgi:hypothetical protein
MSVVASVILISGAAVGSFAIPPHHLFPRAPTSTGGEQARQGAL